MSSESDLVFPPFRLDLAQHQLWRGTERVPLRPKAFAVLHYLVTHALRLVTPAELLQAVWADAYVSEGLLRSYMRELRVVLGDEAKTAQFIATVVRRGWRFLAPVTTAPHPAHPPGAMGAARPRAPAVAPVPASPPGTVLHVAPAMPGAPDISHTRSMVSGEHKQVTILVAGLKGMTTLAQVVETEVLYEVLTRAATLLRAAVERFAGAITQCSGDRLVALFGAPLAQEDHVVRALQAALGVQRAIAAYTDELRGTRGTARAHGRGAGDTGRGPGRRAGGSPGPARCAGSGVGESCTVSPSGWS
jgi:DNA-binding winged helix-turn-helix (wHTH) protein